jgi:hypothetical protein
MPFLSCTFPGVHDVGLVEMDVEEMEEVKIRIA